MAVLLVEHEGQLRGARLPRRVLIGRRRMNHLVIDHRLVSRMHAWIDGDGDRYFLTDTGTRTGTTVNGVPVVSRHALADGDQITIGPARLTFLAADDVPEHAEEFVIPEQPDAGDEGDEKGVLFECACGAPMWAGLEFAGHQGQCRYCGRGLKVPWPREDASRQAGAIPFAPEVPLPRLAKPAAVPQAVAPAPAAPARPPHAVRPATVAPRVRPEAQARRAAAEKRADALLAPPTVVEPTAPAPALPEVAVATRSAAVVAPAQTEPAIAEAVSTATAMCGVCQSGIGVLEESTTCPSCGLSFHAECWTENYGCSAYGCSQVNALAPPPQEEAVAQQDDMDALAAANNMDRSDPNARSGQVPWEFVLLAGSVFSALLGALTFGVPSLAVAGGSVAYMAKNRGREGGRNGIVLLSAGLGVLGVITGVAVSYLIYFGRGFPR